MKLIAYRLSMPNVGSWNGRWTAEGNFYARVRRYPDEKAKEILSKSSYYYNFGDGWGAAVSCSVVNSKEAAMIRRKTKGFYGYDWMIDSIEIWGAIHPRKK